MPAPSQTDPVTLFGDIEQGVWGVVVESDEPRWSLASPDGDALSAAGQPDVEPVDSTTASAGAVDTLELCRVRVPINAGGAERQLDLPGVRCAALTAKKLGSVRLLGMWFPSGPELALAAIRPKSASGQDRDQVMVLAGGQEQPVALDPRLSTTYDGGGNPRRVGIELWLADAEDGEQRSQRMAAQATGASLSVGEGAAPVAAYALRCRSHGAVGTGVYALLQLS